MKFDIQQKEKLIYMWLSYIVTDCYKCKTHGFHTFSCFGPHIWNSLLQDLRHCSTLSSFKAKLKTFSSHSISILTNISTQFLLQSVCVCVCVCVCVYVCVCVCVCV